MKQRSIALVSLLLTLLLVSAAHADDAARRLIIRVMEPVEIPGHVLQPGRYDLTLWDASNGFNFVRISCHDQRCQYGWFPVEPVERKKAGPARIDVADDTARSMERVTEWFYPDGKEGYALVYGHRKHRLQDSPGAP